MNDFNVVNPIVSQARTWGFICHQEANLWLILPQQPNERWKLQQSEDRWILIVGDIPQLLLKSKEVLIFLENRR